MQLVLDTNGLTLSKRNQSFYLRHKTKGRKLISPHRVSSIAIVRDCLISSAAIRLAVKHQIPIHICNATGRAEAAVYSAAYANISTVRRQQVLWERDTRGTAVILEWLRLKTERQIEHLQQLVRVATEQQTAAVQFLQQQQLQIATQEQRTISEMRHQLMGWEGSAARRYWSVVSSSLPPAWQFAIRSRQPATDPFNAVLNYLYGMTYNVVENAIRAIGLDPYFGFLHVDGYQRPTLVYDLIEPFRPWVDALLTQIIADLPQPPKTYFTAKGQGYWLSKLGRQFFIPRYNDYLAQTIMHAGQRTNRRNLIHRQAGELAQQLKASE